jgi:Ala-tRNA(Pro) deacylase
MPYPRRDCKWLVAPIYRQALHQPCRTAGRRLKAAAPLQPENAAMPTTPEELLAYLTDLGIAHATIEHPPLFTVEESQALRGAVPGGHTKNLFVKDKKGSLFLLVAEEDAEIDLKHVHKLIGAQGRVSFGSAELLEEVLGVRPGSVTPLGAVNDRQGRVTLVLEAGLMAHERLNFHPLVNTRTTGLASRDLLAFLRATGHEPRIVAFAEEKSSQG